jgi:tetratricopeptide (TPR) repeat protein
MAIFKWIHCGFEIYFNSFSDMKKLFLYSVLSIFSCGFIRYNWLKRENLNSVEQKKENAYRCIPYLDANTDAGEDGKFITVLPGWGHYSYPISTKNDSARYYFNQGLSMYYSYHWPEANASFRESARFDPASAISYWGQALAMGPGYNFSLHYKMRKEIPNVIQLMNRYSGHASPKEKKLIEVMNLRYSTDTSDKERKILNIAYANGMHELVSTFPNDPDIKILYVDAMMLIHAWDMWNNDGTPKSWTPDMVRLCEEVLKENPKHPAALHYYIHLTEASRHPEVALESANILKDLMPGVGHMVHMSSHEYERNGNYALGVDVNDRADNDMILYESMAKNIHLRQHASHYFAVQAYCGLSGAMYRKGLSDAIRCRKSVTPSYDDTYSQYLYMMPFFIFVRLGKWEEILKDDSVPEASLTYAGLIYDFAKGMAFVNTDHPDSARGRLILMLHKSVDTILSVADTLSNTALQGAEVAGEILSASIFFAEKKYDSAISHITKAIRTEDSLFYSEPKDWLIPARQFLGAFYLKMGKPAMAEKIYREDLAWNPGNGWSLLGLCQSLKAQNKADQAEPFQNKYKLSFSDADQLPPGSVYIN